MFLKYFSSSYFLILLPSLLGSLLFGESGEWGGVRCFSQGIWTPKAPLPAAGRLTAVAFTIGTKGYLGTGRDAGGGYLSDFWQYDPLLNTWTQKANFGGGVRAYAAGFSIGNFGYIGTGYTGMLSYNDFWKYDPLANSWTQVADVGGPLRATAFGFSIGTNGYIGTGNEFISIFQDLWEYDPINNTWTPKANYLGGTRNDIDRAVFVICDKAYMGTGDDGGFLINLKNDFWEYDPLANTWTQKVNFPGAPRAGATGFSIGGRGYLGLGRDNIGAYTDDFWKYNPSANSWSAVTAFPRINVDAPAFVINNKAYVGTGLGNAYYNDLWEYTPDSVIGGGGNVTAVIAGSSNTICYGASVTLSASGGSIYSWSNGSANNTIVVSPAVTTTYSLIASDTICISSDTVSVTITVNQPPIPSISGNTSICKGDSTMVTASGGISYSWNSGSTNNPIMVSPSVNTTYSVMVSDVCGSDTASILINVFSLPNSAFISNSIPCNSTIQFTDNSANSNSWVWDFGDGSTSTIQNPFHAYASGGMYHVTLVANNSSVCSDTSRQTVLAFDMISSLYVPNAFSPNGDNENDLFIVQGTDCVKDFLLVIFNRWGEKVFETNDRKVCWDGTYRGNLENPAVFIYYLEATLTNGDKINKKGNISLIR